MTNTPIRITADVEVLDNATLMALVGPNSEHLERAVLDPQDDVRAVQALRKLFEDEEQKERRNDASGSTSATNSDEPMSGGDEKEERS